MPFPTAAEFTKSYGGGAVAGLPVMNIDVNNDSQPTASQQTEGQLYGGDPISKTLAKAPLISCPNCSSQVSGLAGAKQLYQRDIPETGGKTHQGDIPKCPVPGFEMPIMFYTVEPCNCKVSSEWAGAFQAELTSRLTGNPARLVTALTEAQRYQHTDRLEKVLTKLYTLQTGVVTDEEKKNVDYWIVVVVDQIMRINPGGHNRTCPKELHTEVKQWAAQRSFSAPSKAVPFEKKPHLSNGWQPPKSKVTEAQIVQQYAHLSGGKDQGAMLDDALLAISFANTLQSADTGYAADYKMPKGLGTALAKADSAMKAADVMEQYGIDTRITVPSSGKFVVRPIPGAPGIVFDTLHEATEYLSSQLYPATYDKIQQQQLALNLAKAGMISPTTALNVIGGTPEEQAIYAKTEPKKYVNGKPQFPDAWLEAMLQHIFNDTAFMWSFINENFCPHAKTPLEIAEHVHMVQQALNKRLQRKEDLDVKISALVVAYVTKIGVPEPGAPVTVPGPASGLPKAVISPPPLTAPEPGTKKKRTIRKIKE